MHHQSALWYTEVMLIWWTEVAEFGWKPAGWPLPRSCPENKGWSKTREEAVLNVRCCHADCLLSVLPAYELKNQHQSRCREWFKWLMEWQGNSKEGLGQISREVCHLNLWFLEGTIEWKAGGQKRYRPVSWLVKACVLQADKPEKNSYGCGTILNQSTSLQSPSSMVYLFS